MGFKTFLFMEPWVAAEYFVGAFPGQGHLVVFLDHGAELEHGGVDIPHGRQIMGQDRIKQTVSLGQVSAFQVMMVGIQEFYHLVHIGAVLGGLEGVGPEELIVVHKVKGEGGQALSLLFQFLCADGRYQAGIHAPREEGTDGHI